MRRAISSILDLWDNAGCMGQLVLVLVTAVVVGIPCGAVSLVIFPPISGPRSPTSPTVASEPRAADSPVPTSTVTGLMSATGTPVSGQVASPATATPATAPQRVPAQVVRVVDGDTIDVAIDGQVYRVRYLGIDAPDAFGDYFGQQATARNEALVGGNTIMLEADVSETDSYHRLLRYVYVGDLLVNAELVRLGYARAGLSTSDTRYEELLLRLEREARDSGRGLWAVAQTTTATPEPAMIPSTTPELPVTASLSPEALPTGTDTPASSPTATGSSEPRTTPSATSRPSPTRTATHTLMPTATATATFRPLPSATAEPTSLLATPSPSPECPAAQYFPARLCSRCAEYIGSRRTKVFHFPWCRQAQKIDPLDLMCFYSREEAIDAGYTPDEECSP